MLKSYLDLYDTILTMMKIYMRCKFSLSIPVWVITRQESTRARSNIVLSVLEQMDRIRIPASDTVSALQYPLHSDLQYTSVISRYTIGLT